MKLIWHPNYFDFHHDFAAITLIKNGIIFAKGLGKKKIHYFDYDKYLLFDNLIKFNLEFII